MCTETWCPSRVAALGTAAWSAWLESRAGWPALARGVHPTAVVTVQEAHAVVFPMRALRQPCPFTYASLRGRCAFLLPLGCAARPPAMACRVGVHLGGDGGRERLRGRPSRRLRRLLRGDLAGGEHGAPRPGRLALSPQASADRPAGSPRHCNRSRRRRTQKRWPSPRRARTGGRRCPRRHMVHIPPVVLPVRGRIACSRRAT
jgi:hypothetical protein